MAKSFLDGSGNDSSDLPAALPFFPPAMLAVNASDCRPRSDLTRRLLDRQFLKSVDLTQSYLIGAVIRASEFDSCTLDRCDLDGTKVEQSLFRDTGFRDVDMRGAAFNDCVFERCSFENALLENSVFVRCRFRNCSFERAAVSECVFNDADIDSAKLVMSTWRHNRFARSHFIDTTLGDCTFLYAFFDAVRFERSAINLDAIGLSYGLASGELAGVELVYLGTHGPRLDDDDRVSAIVESYAARGMRLHEAVARLNFGMIVPLLGVPAAVSAIVAAGLQTLPLQRDDVRFVLRLMEVLADRSTLPLLACVNAARLCEPLIAPIANDPLHDETIRRPAAELVSGLTALAATTVERMDEFACSIRDVIGTADVKIRLRYERRPDADLCEIVTGIARASGLTYVIVRRTASRRGSYVEFIAATAAGTLLVLVTLCLINGVVDQLIVLRGKVQILSGRRKVSSPFNRLIHRPMTLDDLPIKKLGDVARIVNGLDAFRVEDLSGLSCQNLKEVAISTGARPKLAPKARRRSSK